MQLSIRRALLSAFIGLVVLLTGVLVCFSLVSESRLERGLAMPLIELHEARAGAQVEHLLGPIRSELAEALRLIERGQLGTDDPVAARHSLLPGFQELRGVGSMMVGDEAGYQLLIMRFDEQVANSPLLAGVSAVPDVLPDDPRFITREFDRARWGESSRWTLWNEAGDEVQATWEVDLPGYDVRARPWHSRALAELHALEARGGELEFESLLVWTGVYTLFTTKAPGMSASLAARDPEGRAVIVAYDVLLTDLTEFTSVQRPTPNGKVFICDADGRAVGLPDNPGLEDQGLRLASLLQPIEAVGGDGLRGWMQQWRTQSSSESVVFGYDENGRAWRGMRAPYELGGGERLIIGVAIPNSDVLQLAGHDPRRILAVAALGLAAAIILALWLAGRLAAPLAGLVAESQRIGNLDLSTPPQRIGSRLVELQALGAALDAMRTALQGHSAQREQAEADLAASEMRFRGTFEQAAVGLVHVAPDGRLLLVNQKLCDFLGYSRDELLSMRFVEFTHPEDRESDLERVRQLIAVDSGPAQWQKRYIHRDGRTLWGEVTTNLLRDDQGRPRYFVTAVQDINERRSLESHLRQSQKLEAVGRLAGGVAHDFNNLLTVISGYAQMARTGLAQDARALRDIEQIEAAAASAAALTHQLLAFARRELSSPRVIDVCSEVQQGQKMIERLISADVELVTSVEGGPHHVLIDPVQLQQVLVNLAVNARDAMPQGGKLTISVAPGAGQGGGDGEVEISVRDTGEGMPADVRAHAFEPFYTTKGVGQGTGLGLATCYGIVEQAGGHIEIESGPGQGTCVRVRLRVSNARPAMPAPALAASFAVQGGTILLVEDEEQIRELVERVLSGHGYRVLAARDGLEALELFEREGGIDLVVTDVIMPGMSGGELATRIRERVPQQRVLFVSGYAQAALAGKIPVNTSLLTKPYTPAELVDRIRIALGVSTAAPKV